MWAVKHLKHDVLDNSVQSIHSVHCYTFNQEDHDYKAKSNICLYVVVKSKKLIFAAKSRVISVELLLIYNTKLDFY